MTESKATEGGAAQDGDTGGDPQPSTETATSNATSTEAPSGAEEPAAPSPIAEPVGAPTSTLSSADEDDGRESIEVEAMEPSKAPPTRLSTHHPPPPPSIRARGAGTRGHFEVTGTPKLAQDLMSRKIFTIGPDDKLMHLEEHMEKFRFGHLPVVQDDKLVGLITHADLLHASASFLTQKAKEIDEIVHNFPASRIMQRELLTVRPTEPLDEVAQLMWEAKVGCVLVTDDKDKLVGIITEGDFLRLAHHFLVQDKK
jgi:CBS domain-containing protein